MRVWRNCRAANRLLMCLLTLTLCSCSVTGPTGPVTERQAWITEKVKQFSNIAGVTIGTVAFAPPPTRRDGLVAAGWVECPKTGSRNTIWFNVDYLESGPEDYLVAVAAHEVCHIYYRENEWPCVADERRASVCGDGLMRGIKP